jgi:hypothetical protein
MLQVLRESQALVSYGFDLSEQEHRILAAVSGKPGADGRPKLAELSVSSTSRKGSTSCG